MLDKKAKQLLNAFIATWLLIFAHILGTRLMAELVTIDQNYNMAIPCSIVVVSFTLVDFFLWVSLYWSES